MQRWPHLPAVVVVLAVLVLGACSSDGGRSGGTATAVPSATSEPVGVAPTSVLDSFTYRYEIRLQPEGGQAAEMTVRVTGSFQAPDRTELHAQGRLGNVEYDENLVVVGQQVWRKDGYRWVEAERSDPRIRSTLRLCPGDPAFWDGFDLAAGLQGLEPEREEMAGIEADHYSLRPDDVDLLRQLSADGLLEGMEQVTLDVWLAEDGGWPARLTLEGTGTADLFGLGEDVEGPLRFRVELSLADINADTVQVEPPA